MTAEPHTWLFRPGSWVAEGTFWESGSIARKGRGRSVVRHLPDRWAIEGEMEIESDPPLRFTNLYTIASPPPCGAEQVPWTSENPAVGRLEGVFVIAGDTILSAFRSATGEHWGSEHLTRITARHYRACGLFLAGDVVISTWSMELRSERDTRRGTV
jgi:hypothetical protein